MKNVVAEKLYVILNEFLLSRIPCAISKFNDNQICYRTGL